MYNVFFKYILPEEFHDFLKYFEKRYVGMPKVVSNPRKTIRLGRKDAKFVPSSWSVYERALVGDPRMYVHVFMFTESKVVMCSFRK